MLPLPPAQPPDTTDSLSALLYHDLRRIARSHVRRLRSGATLQATALIHEAYLRLGDSAAWSGRGGFLAAAGQAMRRIVVEHARRKSAQKRGGGAPHGEPLETVPVELGVGVDDLLALDEALDRLEQRDPRQATIVTLRFFVGLGDAEIAEAVGISERTVRRDWNLARLFLARQFDGQAM